jgi:DNA-binding MarR family transcriptional regulator
VDVPGRIVDALRRYGQDAARLGEAFATRNALLPADLRALVAIMQAERSGAPLTPGRLRDILRLSSGGTTVVVDRLERNGHVERSRDHPDHRVVHLRQTPTGARTGESFFAPLVSRTRTVIAEFTPEEQAAIARFLERAAAELREHLDELEAGA